MCDGEAGGKRRTHQPAVDGGESEEDAERVCEAPEDEDGDAAHERARDHDPRVREAVAHVPEDNLADDGGRIEDREHDRGGEGRGEDLRERRDVQRDRVVGHRVHDRAGTLYARISDYMRSFRGEVTHQEPEERCFEEVHLGWNKARPLSTLVFWHG